MPAPVWTLLVGGTGGWTVNHVQDDILMDKYGKFQINKTSAAIPFVLTKHSASHAIQRPPI